MLADWKSCSNGTVVDFHNNVVLHRRILQHDRPSLTEFLGLDSVVEAWPFRQDNFLFVVWAISEIVGFLFEVLLIGALLSRRPSLRLHIVLQLRVALNSRSHAFALLSCADSRRWIVLYVFFNDLLLGHVHWWQGLLLSVLRGVIELSCSYTATVLTVPWMLIGASIAMDRTHSFLV